MSAFEHIPGLKTTIDDGGLRSPRGSTQEKILVIGPASDGPSYEPYSLFSTNAAERKFGSDSPVMKQVHELIAQGANNIKIMRVGGKYGSVVITDSLSQTLTLTTSYRDADILERYALIIENDGEVNRYLVYDLIDSTWVYDSDELLVQDTGIVELTDTGIELFTLNDREDLTAAVSLADLATGDFSPAATTVAATAGADGLSGSLVERYAALSIGYHHLDYKDADMIVPSEVYLDAANIADDAAAATYGYYWLGMPVAGGDWDKLGYVWQYVYKGTLYTYFTDTPDYFSVSKVAATRTILTDLVLTAQKAGKGGNACTIRVIQSVGVNPPTTVVTENANGGLAVVVTGDPATETTADIVTSINTALAAFTTSTGVLGSTLLAASGGGVTALATVAQTNLTSGAGGHVITHATLTGDTIPSGVSTRFSAGVDAELREVNFAHQLASFCHLASSNWKMIVGAIPVKEPSAYSRTYLSTWVGEKPEYTDNGEYKYIDATADNGSGLLGNKFMAGFAKTSAGYRSHLVTDGDSTDGYAYGGLILTTGASLPNGTNNPYGIEDGDEALDGNSKPIDLGKYIWVCGTWMIHSNNFNGGSSYRGHIAATLLGRLATIPAYREPIGNVNGRVRGVSSVPRIHSTQIDALSELRFVTIRQEDGVGPIFTSVRTAAHPDSDFVKGSTIRSINHVANEVRKIINRYIGEPTNGVTIAAVQSDLDLMLAQKRTEGYHNGAIAFITNTRAQKINGRFSIKLRMVPPFCTEQVELNISIAADESEL